MFNVVTIAWAALLWALGFAARGGRAGLGGRARCSAAPAQFLVQVPAARGGRLAFRPRVGARATRRSARSCALMAPATVGLAAVQVNIFVSTIFASHEPGAVSWLQYAFRLLYLPIGVFGVAVGTIATTGLARRAAAGRHGRAARDAGARRCACWPS